MESASCTLTIGGRISRADVRRLAEAIENDYATVDWDHALTADEAEQEILTAAAAGLPLCLAGADVPWGEFDEVERVCGEFHLTYAAECEAGGDWGAHVRYTTPSEDLPYCWDIGGIGDEPSLPLSAIRKHLKDGSLEAELDLMKVVHAFKIPLEIVEEAGQ